MNKLVWAKEMSVGNAKMDAEHKAMMDEFGRLAQLPDNAFCEGLSTLIAAMESDFRNEEETMEKIDFPALQSHREQHARVLGALHHVIPDVMRGDFKSGRDAIQLLPQWFLFHMSTMDTALAVAIELARLCPAPNE